MKKITAGLLLLLMIGSLLPANVIAQKVFDVRIQGESNTKARAAGIGADVDVNVGIETNTEKNEEERKEEIRTHARNRIETRTDVAKQRILDVRAHQKERFDLALERCEKTNQEEKCKERFTERKEKVDLLSETQLNTLVKVEAKKLARAQELAKLRVNPTIAKFNENTNFRARVISEASMNVHHNAFLNAKADFRSAAKDFAEAKAQVRAKASAYKSCQNDASEKCERTKEETHKHTYKLLVRAADMMISKLEKIKSKAQESEHLTTEESAVITARVDAHMETIVEVKADIVAKGETATKEELKAATKELRQTWAKTKHKAEKQAGRVVIAKIGSVVVSLKHMSAKIDRALTRAAEAGKDVSTVAETEAAFNAEVEAGLEAYQQAIDLYAEAETQAEINTAKAKLREAHAAGVKAHQLTSTLLRLLNRLDTPVVTNDVTATVDAAVDAELANEVSA